MRGDPLITLGAFVAGMWLLMFGLLTIDHSPKKAAIMTTAFLVAIALLFVGMIFLAEKLK